MYHVTLLTYVYQIIVSSHENSILSNGKCSLTLAAALGVFHISESATAEGLIISGVEIAFWANVCIAGDRLLLFL